MRRLESGLLALYRSTVMAGLADAELEAEDLLARTRALGAALAEEVEEDVLVERLGGAGDALDRSLDERLDDLREVVATRGLAVEDLPPDLVRRYQGRDGRMLVYAYPSQNIWDKRFMTDLVADLSAIQPEVNGIAVVFLSMVDQAIADFRWASWAALAAVLVFLLVDFKRPRAVFLTLLPLLLGTLWMVGICGWLGIRFNFINITMVPILLGIGIDDGVHIMHRYRSSGPGTVAACVRHTGRAVLLTSLTTMIGFGAIGTAASVGLASLGLTLSIGIGMCFLTSTIVLPALLALVERRGGGGAGENAARPA